MTGEWFCSVIAADGGPVKRVRHLYVARTVLGNKDTVSVHKASPLPKGTNLRKPQNPIPLFPKQTHVQQKWTMKPDVQL